jgi:integrase/recombinase XerD
VEDDHDGHTSSAGGERKRTGVRSFSSIRAAPHSRSGIEYVLHKHVQTAKQQCPSLATKRVFPHLLRHTCALTVVESTDLRKVSPWLDHAHMQTTEV